MSQSDVLAKELMQRLDEHFLQFTMPRPLPPLRDLDNDTQEALLFEIKRKLERLNWLTEGPDTYDTVDVNVVPGPKETRLDYSPFLIWGVSLLNTQPAGGDRILLRFTDTYGRVKQLPVLPNSSIDLDLKGGLSSVLRLISQTVSVEVTGIILLKWPLADEFLER